MNICSYVNNILLNHWSIKSKVWFYQQIAQIQLKMRVALSFLNILHRNFIKDVQYVAVMQQFMYK